MVYYCKKCGMQFTDMQRLVYEGCCEGGKHEPYRGVETGPWHCVKCGTTFNNFRTLVYERCCRGGKHEPV